MTRAAHSESRLLRVVSLLAHAKRTLGRHRRRTIAIAIGLSCAVALLSAVLFLTESLRAEALRGADATPDITVQRLVGGRPATVRASEAEVIRAMPSVGDVTPRVWGYLFSPALQGNITIVAMTRSQPPQPPLTQVHGALTEGREPKEGAHEMLAGLRLAESLGLRMGDSLGLPAQGREPVSLKLVGTFGSVVDLYTADVLLCDESDARALLGVPEGEATDLAVSMKNPAETRVVARSIVEAVPGARVLERDLSRRVYAISYGRRSGLFLVGLVPALFALLVLAGDRLGGLAADERREIAILKAVGWSTEDVLWSKVLESGIICIFSISAGMLLGYAWVFWLDAPGLKEALVGFSVLYPKTALTPMVTLSQVLAIFAATLGPFLGLAVLSAWQTSSEDPAAVLRT